jgi:hypothetical protein
MDQGSETTHRGEPYTVEEFDAALEAQRREGAPSASLGQFFADPDAFVQHLWRNVWPDAPSGENGAAALGVIVGIRMAEARAGHVWIVETGEYEQRYIVGVYGGTIDHAAAAVRAEYPPPYVVEWETPRQDRYTGFEHIWEMVGHFAAVEGKSVEHDATFTFERRSVA